MSKTGYVIYAPEAKEFIKEVRPYYPINTDSIDYALITDSRKVAQNRLDRCYDVRRPERRYVIKRVMVTVDILPDEADE